MKYGSVCSGIEAATVAWREIPGWEPQFFAEIAPFPSALLAYRFPGVPNKGDFTKIGVGVDAEPIELLVGGTPCESFSVAGKRAGLDDPRGNLAIEFLRLAQRTQPRWILWENVPGVHTSWSDEEVSSQTERHEEVWQSNDFATFLSLFRECGYRYAYRVLDAQYFGVPQRRRRVFVVGYLGDWRPPAAVLFDTGSLSRHLAPRGKTGKRVAGTLEASFARSRGAGQSPGALVEVAACLTGSQTRLDGEPQTFAVTAVKTANTKSNGSNVKQDVAYTLDSSPNQASAFNLAQITSRINRTRVQEGLPASTLDTSGQMFVAFGAKDNGRDAAFDIAPTLRGGGHGTSHPDSGKWIGITDGMVVRRLTPTECERLQGFPDGWTDIPYRGRRAADGTRYGVLGKSMAVPNMRWLGERIEAVDSILKATAHPGAA